MVVILTEFFIWIFPREPLWNWFKKNFFPKEIPISHFIEKFHLHNPLIKRNLQPEWNALSEMAFPNTNISVSALKHQNYISSAFIYINQPIRNNEEEKKSPHCAFIWPFLCVYSVLTSNLNFTPYFCQERIKLGTHSLAHCLSGKDRMI